MVGTKGQKMSFELDLKNEQAFAKPKSRKHCESGEGNSRKQNKTDARQHNRERGVRMRSGVEAW